MEIAYWMCLCNVVAASFTRSSSQSHSSFFIHSYSKIFCCCRCCFSYTKKYPDFPILFHFITCALLMKFIYFQCKPPFTSFFLSLHIHMNNFNLINVHCATQIENKINGTRIWCYVGSECRHLTSEKNCECFDENGRKVKITFAHITPFLHFGRIAYGLILFTLFKIRRSSLNRMSPKKCEFNSK